MSDTILRLDADRAASVPARLDTPKWRDWIALLKPRVLYLVGYTGAVGILLAPGHLNIAIFTISLVCILAAAGACGAINMWYDRDIDAVMRRTAKRPVPIGRIAPESALAFGVVLAVSSTILMAWALNLYAAVLLALSVIFYLLVYTVWLKRRTPQNIVIGGAAGAFPPLIGWVSVTGSMDLLPIVLFGIIFVWTPPHFWALSLCINNDYQRANVPMLAVAHGIDHTRKQIFFYSVIMVVVTLLPLLIGYSGWCYGLTAAALDAIFLAYAFAVIRGIGRVGTLSDADRAQAMGLFRFSIYYLFILFGSLVVDRLL